MSDTLRIHLWPHPALRTVCAPLTAAEFGADLAATAQEMLRIIKRPATRGIGLAANQVGITKRFFVMINEGNYILKSLDIVAGVKYI